VKTEQFISRFFNIKGLNRIAFPPSLYPLDFNRARAARMAIGADDAGNPMLLWAEGAAKIGHTPGADSCGASLLEMAEICEAVGMKNAVNLDGGGSAQIQLDGIRSLLISDRKEEDFSESERPVPMGLMIR
jgi:exopolysaccharide biosynthesis protein